MSRFARNYEDGRGLLGAEYDRLLDARTAAARKGSDARERAEEALDSALDAMSVDELGGRLDEIRGEMLDHVEAVREFLAEGDRVGAARKLIDRDAVKNSRAGWLGAVYMRVHDTGQPGPKPFKIGRLMDTLAETLAFDPREHDRHQGGKQGNRIVAQ